MPVHAIMTGQRTTRRARDQRGHPAYSLALSDALRVLGDGRAIADTACALLAAEVAADRVELYAVDTTHGVADRCGGAVPGLPALADRIGLAATPPTHLQALSAGQVVDARIAAGTPPLPAGESCHVLAVPRVRGGRLEAVIAVSTRQERQWSADDVALVEQTLVRCWAARQRADAERSLRESEERQSFLLRLGDALRPLTDPDAVLTTAMTLLGTYLGVNRAHYLAVQADGDTLRAGPTYLDGVDDVPAELSLSAFGPLIARYRAGEVVAVDDVADVAPPGSPERAAFAAISLRAFLGVPLFRGGQLLAIVGVNQTVPRLWERHQVTLLTEVAERAWSASERARAQQALRDSERRLQTLVAGMPQLVWRADGDGAWTWTSPQWTALTGLEAGESRGEGWLTAVHPDDRRGARAAWHGADRRGAFAIDHRVRDGARGAYRWFQSRATPVRDADGRIVEWLGTSTDIDDLHRLQQRQQILVGELQHRVRNILTVVRSVFGRTIETGRELTEVAQHFQGRLDALARTQVIVTRSAERHVDLEDLIREELMSVAESDSARVRIAGPEVRLAGRFAEMLGLALHELTTNALKYGALRSASGQLAIGWTLSPDEGGGHLLTLDWREHGVAAIAATPGRAGFGRELIEQALPYRLGAETMLAFEGGGVRCVIAVRLPPEGAADTNGDDAGAGAMA